MYSHRNTSLLLNFTTQVNKRVEGWKKHRDFQSKVEAQLKWEAEVVEYVDFVSHATAIPRNSKAGTPPSTVNKTFPLLGPRFCPPSYLHATKRDTTPSIAPEGLYLKSLTVVHPTFFPG